MLSKWDGLIISIKAQNLKSSSSLKLWCINVSSKINNGSDFHLWILPSASIKEPSLLTLLKLYKNYGPGAPDQDSHTFVKKLTYKTKYLNILT